MKNGMDSRATSVEELDEMDIDFEESDRATTSCMRLYAAKLAWELTRPEAADTVASDDAVTTLIRQVPPALPFLLRAPSRRRQVCHAVVLGPWARVLRLFRVMWSRLAVGGCP
jgi:hypothetical protein